MGGALSIIDLISLLLAYYSVMIQQNLVSKIEEMMSKNS
jgi:hypothetical protein